MAPSLSPTTLERAVSQQHKMSATTYGWADRTWDLTLKHRRGDHDCHSQLLETKRTLDGLLDAVNETYTEMAREDDAITEATGRLKHAEQTKNTALQSWQLSSSECMRDAQDSGGVLHALDMELRELWLIGKASVRAEHGVSFVEMQSVACAGGPGSCSEGPGHVPEHGLPMDSEGCRSFAEAALRGAGVGQHNETCDASLQALHLELPAACLMLSELYIDRAQSLSNCREDCVNAAATAYNTIVFGPDGAHAKAIGAVRDIHYHQRVLEQLIPIKDDLELGVQHLRDHINRLEETCTVDHRAHEQVQKIQQMILDMNECAGRNDFKLEIPSWQPPQYTTSPTPSPSPFDWTRFDIPDIPPHISSYDWRWGSISR